MHEQGSFLARVPRWLPSYHHTRLTILDPNVVYFSFGRSAVEGPPRHKATLLHASVVHVFFRLWNQPLCRVHGGCFRAFVYFRASPVPSSILICCAFLCCWCFLCVYVVPCSGIGSGADNIPAIGRSHLWHRRPHAHGWGRDTAARYHSKGEIMLGGGFHNPLLGLLIFLTRVDV